MSLALRLETLEAHLSNEAEDKYLLSLTDSVRSIHGLQISLGVPATDVSFRYHLHRCPNSLPVAVEQYDNVGSDKVDSQTACSSREQEDELFAVGRVIVVDSLNTILMRSISVDPAVLCVNVSFPRKMLHAWCSLNSLN